MQRELRDHEPAFIDAVLRVFEAGQRLILDRIDLARLEVARLSAHALSGAALVTVGAILIAGAWFATLAVVVLWLRPHLSPVASLAILATVTAIAGSAVTTVGLRRARTLERDVADAGEEARLG
jgi:uncharacterized membrane protein